MKAEDIFNYFGPTLTKNSEFGAEPSLKEIIKLYYGLCGLDHIKAQRYTREYIEAWVSMHGNKIP